MEGCGGGEAAYEWEEEGRGRGESWVEGGEGFEVKREVRGLREFFTKESKCWIGRGKEEEARWWLYSGFATGCASGILI